MLAQGLRLALLPVTGSASSSGDNTIVAAPGAGKRLVVVYLSMQRATTADTTVTTKAGGTAIDTQHLSADVPMKILDLLGGREWALPENAALVLNLSSANAVTWCCRYYVEAA